MPAQVLLWSVFGGLIVACLAIDLGIGRHRHGRMPIRVAAIWSAVWIALAFLFAGVVCIYRGPEDAILYVTGYLVEKALSVDNMFVFIVIFSYFAVAEEDQPRVLKWGILGALFFRGVLIAAGWVIVREFQWVLYIFALLLIWAAWKMLTHGDEEIHPDQNPVLRAARRFFPIVNRYEGHRFIVRENGKWHGTALLVVLLVVESTDVMFALDSIPAIFAITQDFFLVFTSNIFAILGLRALFFVLAGVMEMFRFLKIGVAAILFFIALKMLAHAWVKVPPAVSLSVIAAILATSVLTSVFIKPKRPAEAAGAAPGSTAAPAAGAAAAAPAPAPDGALRPRDAAHERPEKPREPR